MSERLEHNSQKLHNTVFNQARKYLVETQGGVKEDNWAFSTATWPFKPDLVLAPEHQVHDTSFPGSKPEHDYINLMEKNDLGRDVHPGDSKDEKLRFGESVLFFGNRNRNADFLFQNDWLNSSHLRVEVFTTFSRDQRQKLYVDQEICNQGKLICSLLDRGAIVYICGSAGAMPKRVKAAFIRVLEAYSGMDEVMAMKAIKQMEDSGRWIQETW